MDEQDEQYWFTTRTRTVEKGRQSHYTHLMGPYPSEAAAKAALDTAAARNETWDDEDEKWDKQP